MAGKKKNFYYLEYAVNLSASVPQRYKTYRNVAASHNKAYNAALGVPRLACGTFATNRGKKLLEFCRLVLHKTFSDTWQTSCKQDVV